MSRQNPTHYEILGIEPDAKHTEIGLAYNRVIARQKRDDAPPSLKGATSLREAFEVLSDLDRRAAYDAELRAARLKPAFAKGHALMAVGFLVLVGAGLYWYLRPKEPPPRPGLAYDQVLAKAVPAIARLQTLEMSGQSRDTGVAFAIEQGVLVTSCQGLSPTAQLAVVMAPRVIPARISLSDESTGFCKLDVAGAGSWPLPVSPEPARTGDRIWAAQIGSKGEVLLREGQVKSVRPAAKGAFIEVTVPFLPLHGGAPLLDIHGRVVAVTNMPAQGKPVYVALSHGWSATVRPNTTAPAPTPEPGADDRTDPQKAAEDARFEKLPPGVSRERAEKLDKAFRPPPKVPDDL